MKSQFENTKAVKLVNRRFKEASENAQPHFERFKRFDALWDGGLPDEFMAIFQQKEFQDLTHYIPPRVFEITRDFTRKVINSLFSVEPNFELGYYGQKEEHPKANSNRRLLVFQHEEPRGAHEIVMEEATQQMARYGHSVLLPEWWKDYDSFVADESGDEFHTEVSYEGPRFKVYPAYQALPSPHFDDRGHLIYCLLLEVIPFGDLLELQRKYPEKYHGVRDIKLEDINLAVVNKWSKLANVRGLETKKEEDKDIYPVFLIHYLDGKRRYVVANQKYEIANYSEPDRSAGLGLIWQPLIKKQGTVFGKGLVEVIEDALYEAFEKRWSRLNRQKRLLNPGGVTTEDQAPSLLQAGAGRLTKVVGDIANYKFYEDRGLALNAAELEEEGIILTEIKRAVGYEDIAVGYRPQQKATATRDIQLTEEAAENTRFTLRRFESIQKGIIRKELQLNRQFLPFPLPLDYERAGINIKRSDIDTNWTIRPLGVSEALSRPIMQKVFDMIIERLTSLPPHILAKLEITWYELILSYLNAFRPHIRNIDKILIDPEISMMWIEKENVLLSQGVSVPVDPREDHQKHLFAEESGHIVFMNQLIEAGAPKEELMSFQEHIAEHQANLIVEKQGGENGEMGAGNVTSLTEETPGNLLKPILSGNMG